MFQGLFLFLKPACCAFDVRVKTFFPIDTAKMRRSFRLFSDRRHIDMKMV